MAGEIDVDGDLTGGLRRAGKTADAARRGTTADGWAAHSVEDSATISHHYDLSNDFYRLLLGEHMAYSSGHFTHDGQSLHDAQTTNLNLVCSKLDLTPGTRLLKVGCAR